MSEYAKCEKCGVSCQEVYITNICESCIEKEKQKAVKAECLRNKKILNRMLATLRKESVITFKDKFENMEQLHEYLVKIDGKIELVEELLLLQEKEPEKEAKK